MMTGRRLRITVGVGTALLLAAFAGGTAVVLDRTHDTAHGAALASVERTARLVETVVNRQLLGVDSVLAGLPGLIAAAGTRSPPAVGQLLQSFHGRALASRDILIVRPDGEVWAAASPRAMGGPLPFPVAASAGSTAVTVHGPIRNARTGDWSLYLARPITLPGEGVVLAVAEVPAAILTAPLAEFGNAPGFRVALRRADGTLLASLPHDERAIGRVTEPGAAPTFETHRATLFGDVEAVAELDAETGLSAWRRDAARLVTVVAIASAGAAAFALLIILALRRLEGLEAERRRAQGMLDDAIAAMSDGFVMWDAEDRLVTCNRPYLEHYAPSAFLRVPGARYEDIVREGVKIGQYPQAGADVEAFVAETVAWHRRAEDTFERLLPDGRWLLVTERRTANGGMVGIRTDITAFKRAIAERAEANERAERTLAELTLQKDHFDAALATMAHGLLMYDSEQRITVVNDRFFEIYGLSADLRGTCLTAEAMTRRGAEGGSFAGLDGDAAWARTLSKLARREPYCAELKGLDGRVVAMTCSPTPDGGWLTVHEDITARKRTETVLAAARSEAEAARGEAERASQAKTEFLASMSHEVRTPLNGIIGYTDLLLDDATLTSVQRRHAERIQSAGAALLTVVNDILDFSKIEAGQIDLDPQPFALEGLVDNAVSIVRSAAERKGLALDVEVETDLPSRLIGDQDRLRQIMLNLLNNAIKFTARGSVTLLIAREAGQAEAERLRFTVVDTGIGIPRDKSHRLFQRFSQIDGSIRREFGGTGLGLAISKRLVELMGGTIGVESEVAKGSRFWFAVPLDATGAAVPALAGDAPTTVVRPARILLVEDVEINQDLARTVLEGAGHRVDVAGDGAEAIRAVEANAYDLVLMDIQMPGMDGMTATRRIRALGGAALTLPIIAMTANVLPAQVGEFRAAGMDDHVGKPFRRDELYAAIARWTRAEAAPVAPDAMPATPPPPATQDLDAAAFDELTGIVGAEGVKRMLGKLVARLERSFAGPDAGAALSEDDRARLKADAHAMVSAAGALGFLRFSDLCVTLETACLGGGDVEEAFSAVATTRDRLLAQIEVLRAA